MYAISFLLVLGALVTLVVGWVMTEELTLIFVSIGLSVLAAIVGLIAVFRKRELRPATAGAPFGPEEGTEEAKAAAAGEPRAERPRAPLPQRRPAAKRPATKPTGKAKPAAEKTEELPEAPATKAPTKKSAAKKGPAKKPAAKKTTKKATKKAAAKKGPAKKAAAKKTAASSSRKRVVSIEERGTYHQSDCRYVQDRDDTERITVATAKKRGYTACGVCKPG